MQSQVNRFVLACSVGFHIDQLDKYWIWAFPRQNPRSSAKIRKNFLPGSRCIFYSTKGASEGHPFFSNPALILTTPGDFGTRELVNEVFDERYDLGFRLNLLYSRKSALYFDEDPVKSMVMRRPDWISALRAQPSQAGTPVSREDGSLFDDLWRCLAGEPA